MLFDELEGFLPIHECNGYLMSKNLRRSNYSGASLAGNTENQL